MKDYAKEIDNIIVKWAEDACKNGRKSDIEYSIGQAIKESFLLFGVIHPEDLKQSHEITNLQKSIKRT